MPSLKQTPRNNQHISLDDVCFLISTTSTEDELGQPVETETERQVFCSRSSVSRQEFSAAGQLDLKPQITVIVDSDEYDGEKSLEYRKKKYHVYRDFMRPDGFTELYCEVKAGG